MSKENFNKSLSEIEKTILKKLILDKPNRPSSYKFSEIYRFFNYQNYVEEDIKLAIGSLVDRDYLVVDNGYYSLTRDMFLMLKQKYRIQILLNSEYNKFLIPLIVGALSIGFSSTFDILGLISKNEEIASKDNIEYRIDNIEKRISDFDEDFKTTPYQFDSTEISMEIVNIKSQYSKLSNNINSLNLLLQDNPSKFIEISTIIRDIDYIKKDIIRNNETLKREVDRISSYNNTLIVFMITFLIAYVGIGIFNFMSRNKNSTI